MILAVLASLASQKAASAGDSAKTFPVSQCRYTLPGKDWSWVEPIPPNVNAVCVARNGDGLVFMLTIFHAPADAAIDAKFADGFDPSANKAERVKKRGDRITTFKGLPCYECEWLVNGQMTSVIRVVLANGFAYQLQLLGNADPVEKRPDFETIMNGFEFTSPPVRPDPNARGKAVARQIGGLVPYGMLGACVLLLVLGLRKKQSTPSAPRS